MGFIAKEKDINFLYPQSEALYRRLIESVKNGIYMADKEGRLFFVNQAFVEILGFDSKDEILGLNLAQHLYCDLKDREVLLKKMEERGYVSDYIVRNRRKDGSEVVLSATSNFIKNDQGEIIGVEGIVRDITEKAKLEEQLAVEKRKLEEILGFDEKLSSLRKIDRLTDFVVKKAADILEAEKCSLMLIDKNAGELCIKAAKGLSEEVIKRTVLKVGEAIAGVVAQAGKPLLVRNIEYDPQFKRANRLSYKTRSFLSVPVKLEEKLIGVLNVSDKNSAERDFFNELDLKILVDLSREVAVAIENVKLYKELNYLTITDALTELHNYRYFTHHLDYEIERLKRFPAPLALLLLDIDNFKSFNEQYGRAQADAALKEISHLLEKNIRGVDILCRYAADEFVIILPGTDKKGLRIIAEKLQAFIEKSGVKTTLSIGAAIHTPGMTRVDLVLSADRALSEAKKEGKNRIKVYG